MDFVPQISDVYSLNPGQQHAEIINTFEESNNDRKDMEVNEAIIDCIYCPFRSSSDKVVQDHLEECHICRVCHAIFEEKELLQKHASSHNKPDTVIKAIQCPYCKQNFRYNHHMLNHIKESHITNVSIKGRKRQAKPKPWKTSQDVPPNECRVRDAGSTSSATVSLSGKIIPLDDILNFCNWRKKSSSLTTTKPPKKDVLGHQAVSQPKQDRLSRKGGLSRSRRDRVAKVPCYDVYLNNVQSAGLKRLYLDDHDASTKYYLQRSINKATTSTTDADAVVRVSGQANRLTSRARKLVTSTQIVAPATRHKIDPAEQIRQRYISENKAMGRLWNTMLGTSLSECERVPSLDAQLDRLLSRLEEEEDDEALGIRPPLVVCDEDLDIRPPFGEDLGTAPPLDEAQDVSPSLDCDFPIKESSAKLTIPSESTTPEKEAKKKNLSSSPDSHNMKPTNVPLKDERVPQDSLQHSVDNNCMSNKNFRDRQVKQNDPKRLATAETGGQSSNEDTHKQNKSEIKNIPVKAELQNSTVIHESSHAILTESEQPEANLPGISSVNNLTSRASQEQPELKTESQNSSIKIENVGRKKRRKPVNPVQRTIKRKSVDLQDIIQTPKETKSKASPRHLSESWVVNKKFKSEKIPATNCQAVQGLSGETLNDEFCPLASTSPAKDDGGGEKKSASSDTQKPNRNRKRSLKMDDVGSGSKKTKQDKRKSLTDPKLARVPEANPYAKKAQSFRRDRSKNVGEKRFEEERSENLKRSLLEPYCDVCQVLLEHSPDTNLAVDEKTRHPAQSVVWMPQAEERGVSTSADICHAFPVSKLMVCDRCKVCVHAACYQVDSPSPLSEADWVCDRCRSEDFTPKPGASTACSLCNNKSTGAVKFSSINKQFYHIRCALLMPEITTTTEVDLRQVPRRRWNVSCLVCDQVGKEPAVHCRASKECMLSFHPSCVFASGIDCALGPENQVIIRCSFCIDKFQLKEAETKQKYLPQDINVGETVRVLNNPGIEEGRVVSVDQEVVYAVAFDDGSFCDSVEPENVIPCDSAATEPCVNAPVKIKWEGSIYSGVFKEKNIVYWYNVKVKKRKGRGVLKTLELARSDLVKLENES